MLTRSERPWTNVYGVARTMLAIATLLTLAANPVEALFQPLRIEDAGVVDRRAVAGASLFVLARAHLGLAKLVAIAVLLVAASGWRPRLTAIPHWWVTYSLAVGANVIDGGDQVAATLVLLLVPVALGDSRRWHWSGVGDGGVVASTLAQTAELLIRLQISVIYLFAAVLKFPSEDWANGTALYYWWLHPKFGTTGLLRVVTDVIGPTRLVVPATWGVLVFELCLAAALLAPLRFRSRLLPVAILFHVGIGLVHGMPTFALTMSAGLILFLRPSWRPFERPLLLRVARRASRAAPREEVPSRTAVPTTS